MSVVDPSSTQPAAFLMNKKGKPAKVYTLRQLCSQRFHLEQPELVHTPTKLFDRSKQSGALSGPGSEFFPPGFFSPKSNDSLEGWLQQAFEEQQVAVGKALATRQQWMMRELLGKLEVVSPTNRSPSAAEVKLPVPAQISARLNSRDRMDPVEPQAPPLPPFPPLPNQLPNHMSDPDAEAPGVRSKSGEFMTSLEIPRSHQPGRNRIGAKPDALSFDEDEIQIASRPSKDSGAASASYTGSGSKSPTAGGRPSQSLGASRTDVKLFRRADDFLDQLKMPFWHPGRIVKTTQFDAFICAVIMLNTLVMAFESQYLGLQRGYDLGYPRFTLPASEEWPIADLAFFMLDWVFGVIYFLEICIKITGLKCAFMKDPWNYFDTSLVLFWLVEKTLSAYATLDQGLLRVLRMGRVLRLLRLVKTIQGFDALYIMTTAMQGSVTVLFWSFVLLMVVQTLIAFTLNQALDSYFKDKTKPINEQHQVFEYFGTAGRAMFTMFELTLANWPVAARILQENVTEYYGIFSVAYKLVIGFAAVGIINAVFMQETFKVAASDDKLMMRQKERDRMLHTKKMRTLFAAADESGDGVLDQDEFREIMNSPDIRTWLAAQELPVRDPDLLWKLLDDGDAELTADELVVGVERLKGNAKGIDLAAFMMETREFQSKICQKLGIEPDPKEEDDDDDDD